MCAMREDVLIEEEIFEEFLKKCNEAFWGSSYAKHPKLKKRKRDRFHRYWVDMVLF